MTDMISITGLVATTPKHVVTGTGLSITSFRFASTQRKFDRENQKWVDGETNWYSVATFRQLATNVVASVQKGQRLVITGRLRVRDWAVDDKHGTNVEIDAEAVGHDLSWGTTVFTRSTARAVAESEAAEGEQTVSDDVAGDGEPDEIGTTHSAIESATAAGATAGGEVAGESGAGDARSAESVGAAVPF